jgi:hypothetical protein
VGGLRRGSEEADKMRFTLIKRKLFSESQIRVLT